MLRAPPGHSSLGRLLRHHDPGLKTHSEQLCAQTRSDLYPGTGVAELSLPRDAVPSFWGQQGCGGLGTRGPQGCCKRVAGLCQGKHNITPRGDNCGCSSPRSNLEVCRRGEAGEGLRSPRWAGAGRAAQGQPQQPCAVEHGAKGDRSASARGRAVRAFKQAACPLPSFPCLKADGRPRQHLTLLQTLPCQAQQHPREDAAWVY